VQVNGGSAPPTSAPKYILGMYGGNAKTDTPGEMTPFPHSLLIKVDVDRKALEQDRRFFYPAYLGPHGWLGLDFTAGALDWGEVRELVDASCRLIAPRKMIRQLDAG
jgi:hypothetical protein